MAGLLGDNYTPDPLAQGLLGLGSALLTPRQLGGGLMAGANAFTQGATQAAMLRRQMAADAERSQYMRDRSEMERKRFGMDEKKFGLEMDDFEAKRADAARQRQFVEEFIATAAQKDPEIAMLARVDMKAAIERAYPKPEWRTWFDEKTGRQTQGYAAPGQAPQQVGGVERKVQGFNLGDRYVFGDPADMTGPLAMGQSPDSKASTGLGYARLGEDRRQFGITSGISRERLDFDRSQASSPQDKWVTNVDRGIQVNERTGEARPITQAGAPIGQKNDDAVKRQQNIKDALTIIEEAGPLIEKSTASYAGTAFDKGAQVFGFAPAGAVAGGRLKTLQGALMMRMPRMEGPQSNLDVQLYRESVGQIGDTTIPVAIRKAALDTVKRLQEKYAGIEPSGPVDFKDVGLQSGGRTINFSDLKK